MERAASPERGVQGTESSDEWTKRLPLALLAVAMVISTWLVLSLNSGLTFINDEWDPLLSRPGWGLDQIFAPFNGHPTMIPMVIYKTVQEIFGMDSTRPVQIIHAALLLVMNGLLFVYLRRRVGAWAALIGTVMVLFLGAAFEVLVFSFAMNFVGAIAAGIGALLALDRDDRKGDIAASILLVVGICFSMLIVPFMVAVAAEWLLNPRDRKERAFILGIPVGVLIAWWFIWGSSEGTSTISSSNILAVPGVLIEGLGYGFISLFGMATGDFFKPDQPNLIWGQVMAVVAIALAWWRIKVLGSPPRDFLVVAAGLLAYLLLLAISGTESRQPHLSRFQLPTVIFLLMIASTLIAGIKMKTSWLVAGGIVASLSIQSGVGIIEREAKGQFTAASQYFRTLALGIELAGADADESARNQFGIWANVSVGEFLEATEKYGSPAPDRAEIGNLDSRELYWLDSGLVIGLGAGLDAEPPAAAASTCRRSGAGTPIEVEPGRYRVENGTDGEVTVLIARLGPTPGTAIGATLPNSAAGLDLPAGDLVEPWQVSFEPSSPAVKLCGP